MKIFSLIYETFIIYKSNEKAYSLKTNYKITRYNLLAIYVLIIRKYN